MAKETLAQDLSDLLATKNFDVKYTDEKGQDSTAADARVFAFDWVASSGRNYGTVVIVLGDDNDLQMFFGDNIGRTMDDPQDKLDWFGSERQPGFLEEISRFATGHGLGTFSPKNINQLRHTMQGMAAIKEGLFEGYYGNRKTSYMGEATQARLVIRHNRMIGEDDKRYRYVESLFIETADQERFRLPFTKLSGGRAMLEHVKQGGRPYDIRGQHIAEIVQEMSVLSRFRRASQQRVYEGVTQELVETVHGYYQQLKENLQSLGHSRGYVSYFETWTPADITDSTALVEDLKTLFVEQTLDARIEAALPTLAKIQQRGRAMKEAQIFEAWADQVMEGTWALPDTPEAQAKLNELMSKELIVGPDATNATEQLYDVIGDDELFDILSDLAQKDPRANIWDDTDVQARLAELGIQTPQSTAAEPADVAQDQAPAKGMAEEMTSGELAAKKIEIPAVMRKKSGDPDWKVTGQDIETSRERTHSSPEGLAALQKRLGIAEQSELRRIAELAQVPVKESVLTDSTGDTLQHILNRFKHEVKQFEQGADLDTDLYHALYDYYSDAGEIPYGVAKGRTGDPFEWVTDRLDQELGTGNYAPRMAEADPMNTFEMGPAVGRGILQSTGLGALGGAAMDIFARLGQGKQGETNISNITAAESAACNMTAEGEYCPEHGLSECGYMESMGGTVAGSVAPAARAMDEANADPMDSRHAVTDSFYEDATDPLVRLKVLALSK